MRPSIAFAAFASCTALGLLAAASWLAGSAQEPAIAQPLEVNHAVHAKEGIACDDCQLVFQSRQGTIAEQPIPARHKPGWRQSLFFELTFSRQGEVGTAPMKSTAYGLASI